MRLELQASPEEIREKSIQLLETLGGLISGEAPEIAEALEKALPAKESELKYPVLRFLAERSRDLYQHHTTQMLEEIETVLREAVGLHKAREEEDGEELEKAHPLYIGPKGGKWADPQHKHHWEPDEPAQPQGREMAKKPEAPPEVPLLPDEKAKEVLIALGDELYSLQSGQHHVIDNTGFNHYDYGYWHSVRGNLSGMRKMLAKYKGQITSGHGALVYYQCGLHLAQKTEGLKIQPQYHETFGSLMLPLDGFFKGNFKQYCSVVKEKYGASFDGNKKCFYIPKLSVPNFDFAGYKADMAKFGIEVAEPIGTPPKAEAAGAVSAQYTPENVDELVKGIHSNHVKDTIVVRQRPDGIFEFHAPYAPAFNTLFANKGGQLSGITKYNPISHARETFDLDLTEEAIDKLKALFPKWKIVTHGVKEARIKRDQEIAELQKPIPEVQEKMDPKYKLMSYQNEAVRFLDKANGNALIGDEMGLGKTLETLAWAAKNNKKVLVVCPKVVRKNWLEEAHKFFPGHFHGAELIASQLKKGQTPDLSGVNIATVNYESLAKFGDAIKAAGFDTIIIDESHRMKNPKAQATQNIQDVGAGMKHHILLSGTAIKNKKEELFTQLDLVAPGKFSKNAIKTAPIGGLWMDMHAVYLARAKNTVLKDLPEKTTSIVKHPVTGLPDMGNENTVGAIAKLKVEIAKGKVPVTKAMVQEILDTSDSKILVFTDSVEAAKSIKEAFGDLAILHHGQLSDKDRDAAVKEFQKKDEAGNFITDKRIFVTTRQSMAVGATLTAADKVVFNDLPWTAADVRQAEDRAHRVGQKNAVNVYWMTAEGNLFDENVNDILKRKYELGQKLNQGKQLTAAEMEWMSKPISAEELIAQIHGQVAGPKEGSSAEEAEEPAPPQVPAKEDMAHPELAPPLPEPTAQAGEALPGSAVVVEVPWQEVPHPGSGVDKPLTAEMLDKLHAEISKPKEPAPAPAPKPAEATAPEVPAVEKKPEPVKAPVAVSGPAPAPQAKPEHGSAPAQTPAHSFAAFLEKHGLKIREHKSDPSKVMIKVPKHETEALAKLKDYGFDEPSFEGGQYHLLAVAKQKVKDLLMGKSLADFLEMDEDDGQLPLFVLRKAVEAKPEEAKSVKFSPERAHVLGQKIGIVWHEVDFSLDQFIEGLSIELEHGSKDPETDVTHNSPTMTGKIAWAHLKEDPHYYEKLKKLEKGGPYIGPKGGMWADPQHTEHYDPKKESGQPAAGAEEPERWKLDRIEDLRPFNWATGKREPAAEADKQECDRCGKKHAIVHHLVSSKGKHVQVGSGCGPKLVGGAEFIDKQSEKEAKQKLKHKEIGMAEEKVRGWIREAVAEGKKQIESGELRMPKFEAREIDDPEHEGGKRLVIVDPEHPEKPWAKRFNAWQTKEELTERAERSFLMTAANKLADKAGVPEKTDWPWDITEPIKTNDARRAAQDVLWHTIGKQLLNAGQLHALTGQDFYERMQAGHPQGYSLEAAQPENLEKGGPYIGPKGGMWSDPQHTHHWSPIPVSGALAAWAHHLGGKVVPHKSNPELLVIKVPKGQAAALAQFKQEQELSAPIIPGNHYHLLMVPKSFQPKVKGAGIEQPAKKEGHAGAVASAQAPAGPDPVSGSVAGTAHPVHQTVGGFTPADNLEAAHAYVAHHAPHLDVRYPDVVTANAVNKALSEQHPDVVKHLRFIGTPKQLRQWAEKHPEENQIALSGKHAMDLRKQSPLAPEASATAFPYDQKPYQRSVMVVQPGYFTKEHAEQTMPLGHFSVGHGLAATIRHECGHVEGFVLRHLRPKGSKLTCWEIWKKHCVPQLKQHKKDVMQQISDYAATNPHECWAEVSVARRSGLPLPEWVHKALAEMQIDTAKWEELRHG